MLFTIITVCKNNLQELIQTYSSIISQDSSDFEWIVIDGDSTDGTKNWLQANSLTKSWKSEPDKGIYDAMNKGVELASGDYLIFMNSGDEFADEHVLSKISDIVNVSDTAPALLFGDSIDVNENGKEYYRKAKRQSSIKFGMITQHQAMFFHKPQITKKAYPEAYKLSADYALISKIIKSNSENSIVKVDFPLCKFKMGGTNESKRFSAIKEDYRIRKEILKLSTLESSILYFLHFNHGIVKKLFKGSRFIRHKNLIVTEQE